jgi:AcrR family transcriptional regulator
MHVFRHRGFVAATVRDLEAATGLTSGSLYNTYGDKKGLFDAASGHYLRMVLARRIRDHAPEGSGIAGLRVLFLSLLKEPGGTTHGCLITNSAVEFADQCPEFVAQGFACLRAAFASRLAEAQGGVVLETDLTALLALYQGVLVLLRSGVDSKTLEPMIFDFFDKLEARNGA